MAIEIYSRMPAGITAKQISLPAAGFDAWKIVAALNDTAVGTSPWVSQGVYAHINNLQPKTYYKIEYYYLDHNYSHYAGSISNVLTTGYTWPTSVLNAMNNKGKMSTLTINEWDIFLDQVCEVMYQRKLKLNGSMTTTLAYAISQDTRIDNNMVFKSSTDSQTVEYLLNACRKLSDNKILTAQDFNTVYYIINAFANSPIDTTVTPNVVLAPDLPVFNKGDTVLGSYFTNLTTLLNNTLPNTNII